MESARTISDTAIEYDLGNLCAFDPSPLDESQLRADPDGVCAEVATTVAQRLFAQLFSLPTAPAPVGRLAQLPPPTTALPRHKPLPKPREPTKWEKFAQQKGIDKKKRSKLVFDEGDKEWKRRYGYKRANDPADIPIIEAKAGEEPGEDPFTKQREEKRAGIKAQEKRQLANAKASAKAGAPPSTLRLAATLPGKGKGKPNKRRELADDVRSASRQAGVSTASMGKFDKRLALEKPGERALPSKRQQYQPATGRSAAEQQSTTGMVDRILRERSEDLVDVSRAVGGLQAEHRAQKHRDSIAEDGPEDAPRAKRHMGKSKGRGRGGSSRGASRGGDRRGGRSDKKGGRLSGLKAGAGGGVSKRGGKGAGKGRGGAMGRGRGRGRR